MCNFLTQLYSLLVSPLIFFNSQASAGEHTQQWRAAFRNTNMGKKEYSIKFLKHSPVWMFFAPSWNFINFKTTFVNLRSFIRSPYCRYAVGMEDKFRG